MTAAVPTPWSILAPLGEPENAPKPDLVWVSRDLEGVALGIPGSQVHATLQHARYLTELTELVYLRLGRRGTPAHLYGVDLSLRDDVADTVRRHDLAPDSPLVAEWSVLVTSPDHCVALAAVETGPGDDTDGDRRFDWVTSTDEAAVRAAVASLPTV